MSEELVTCAFTTFNASQTIERAILSAINQTYSNIEIIVVDDCSEDNTLEIINKVSKKNKFSIKIIKLEKNMGVGFTRNICIENAKGIFICFFDDDDYSYSLRIETQIKKLREYEKFKEINNSNNTSALCYSDRLIHYQKKKSIVCKSMIVQEIDKYRNQFVNSMLYADGFPPFGRPGSTATCTLFARKSLLLNLSMFNSNLRRCEDSDLAIRALMNKVEIISTKTILVDQYYLHNINKNLYDYEMQLVNIHKSWLDKFGLYDFSIIYIKLKNSFFNYHFFKFAFLFFFLILKFPFKTTSRIISSLRTIIFSVSHRFKY